MEPGQWSRQIFNESQWLKSIFTAVTDRGTVPIGVTPLKHKPHPTFYVEMYYVVQH